MLFEAGPVMSGGFGPTALTHLELRAYQDNMGIELSPWEVITLRGLSFLWIAESREAEKDNAPAPFVGSTQADYRREKLPKYIKSFLRE